jgi:two-component system sensor histidine kinase QseC
MRTSIRRLLLINLLLAFALIIVLTSIAVYFLGSHDVDQLMDRELVHTSLLVQALSQKNIEASDYKAVQQSLDNILYFQDKYLRADRLNRHLADSSLDEYPLQFQLWNSSDQLIIHSKEAPKEPLSNGKEGFSKAFIDGQQWRVFTRIDNSTGNIYIVGARNALQLWLKRSVARDEIYIMILIFPLLGILIWLALAYGLSSLKKVANELATRAPNYLEPVDLDSVPEEIGGLVDELNKLFLRLKQALDREQRFAGDAAHELRTPLAALKTHAQIALKSTTDDNVANALNKVMAAVERSTHVVQQLLTLSRLVPGSTLNNQSVVDIVAIAREIIGEIAPIAIKKEIDLELITNKENVNIIANGITLGILLRNLIDNSVRYIEDHGKISIQIEEDHRSVTLAVVDNGPGIPPKLRARVFERFFRVLGTNAPGSGLGLAIVKQIAELHGAKLNLGTPSSGKGLKVSICFSKPV